MTGAAAPETPETSAGWSELLTRNAAPCLAVVCLGVWLHAADGLMVATMTPAILADIGGAELVAWTLALYELGSITAGAAGGLLALRHGLRATMTIAALVFGVGCAVSALAPDMPALLAGRLLQGLGGGGLMALSFVAVATLFPRRQMPLVLAAVSALWGVSSFIGPLVGGLFAGAGLWRGGFWFFALQAALLALAIRAGLPAAAAPETPAGRLPLLRLALLAAAILAIAAAGLNPAPLVAAPLVALGAAPFAAFLRADARREADRLLPRRPLDPRSGVGAALLMIVLMSAAVVALTIYGPVAMVRLHGVSPLTAGYVIAAASIGWSAAAVLVARLPERLDGRMILAGMALIAIAVTGYAWTLIAGPVWAVAVFAALEGVGFGMSWTFVLRRATALAGPGDAERLASSLPVMQRVGFAFGAAGAGLAANAAGMSDGIGAAELRHAASVVFALCIPLAVAGALTALIFVRARPA